MQEVEVEDNELDLRVFINGVPDFTKMPKEIAESFLSAVEKQIVDFYKANEQNKGSEFLILIYFKK